MPEKVLTICENYGVDVWVPVEYWKVVKWYLTIRWDPSRTTISKWALYIKWTEDWAGGGELEVKLNNLGVYRNSASGWPPVGDERTVEVTHNIINGDNVVEAGMSGVGFLNRHYTITMKLAATYEGEDTITISGRPPEATTTAWGWLSQLGSTLVQLLPTIMMLFIMAFLFRIMFGRLI